MTISNPQYPHTFVITRQINTGNNAMPTWVEVAVHSGICRFYPDNGGSEKGGVKIADYKVSIPSYDFNIKIGDSITCFGRTMTDLILRIDSDSVGRITTDDYVRLIAISEIFTVSGLIKLAHAGNLGANIWFNIVSN